LFGDLLLRATRSRDIRALATYEDANVGFDIRARFEIDDRFMLFGNVNNVFDRDPPLITVNSTLYDVVGRCFTVGARVDF